MARRDAGRAGQSAGRPSSLPLPGWSRHALPDSWYARTHDHRARGVFERTPIGTKVVVLGPKPLMPFKADLSKVLGRQPEAYWNQVKRDFRRLLKGWESPLGGRR